MKKNIIIWSVVGFVSLAAMIGGTIWHFNSGERESQTHDRLWAKDLCPTFRFAIDPSYPEWANAETIRAYKDFNKDIKQKIYGSTGPMVTVYPQSAMTKKMKEGCAIAQPGSSSAASIASAGALGYTVPVMEGEKVVGASIFICTANIKAACENKLSGSGPAICQSVYRTVMHEMVHPLAGPTHFKHGTLYNATPPSAVMSSFLTDFAARVVRECDQKKK